jgi:hypothetical protein
MFKPAGLSLFLSLTLLKPSTFAQQITRHEVGVGLYRQSDTAYAETVDPYKLALMVR